MRDGDVITIDALKGTLDFEISGEMLAKRKKAWKRPKRQYSGGLLLQYASLVTSASKGAVMMTGDAE